MRTLQRYVVCAEIASGGMAAVHIGHLRASPTFARTVAIKAMHAQFAKDEDFRSMFLDEARIVARIRHPHVVSTLDILEEAGDLFLVMDYVHGPALSTIARALAKRGEPMPEPIAVAIIQDTLEGLHAAHEARDELGKELQVVHRDVSPQNVLVGDDGLARVVDFGIATAADRLHMTKPGEIKGKISYMSPEQIQGREVDRRADIYAVGAMLFEALTGRRAFVGDGFAAVATKQLSETPPRVSAFRSGLSPAMDEIVDRALEKDRDARYATAREMSDALGALRLRASPREIGDWVKAQCKDFFERRDALLAASEREAATSTSASAQDHTEKPTVVEVVAKRPTYRGRVLAIALATAGVGGALALVGAMSRTHEAPTVAKASSGPATAVAASSAPAIASTTAAPVIENVAPIASAPPKKPTVTVPQAPPKRVVVDAEAAPQPECCTGTGANAVRIHFDPSGCRDNCPAGK